MMRTDTDARPVRLTRKGPGHYTAMVVPRGAGGDPYEATVKGPESDEARASRAKGVEAAPGERWVVQTDAERFFATLADARTYLNRFFAAPDK